MKAMQMAALTICCVAGAAATAQSQQHKPKSDAELIANAMSAAPPAISHDATIIAMDGDKKRTLRAGKNEYTCVPDDPGSPGNDPMSQCHALAPGVDGAQGRAERQNGLGLHAARRLRCKQR